jgi:uncharacterized membrane protein (UPF0127 family)
MSCKYPKNLLLIAILATAIFTGCHKSIPQDKGLVSLKAGGKDFSLTVAKNPETKSIGLSGISDLAKNKGMVFVYDKNQTLYFWMKDTLIPLDIVFADGCKVVDFQSMAVEPDPTNPKITYTSKAEANIAIEIKKGILDSSIIGSTIPNCSGILGQ